MSDRQGPKQPYNAPRLTVYGSMRDLTAAQPDYDPPAGDNVDSSWGTTPSGGPGAS